MRAQREYPPDEYRIEGRDFRDALAEMLRSYFAEVKRQTGSYRYRGHLWHAYTFGYQTALHGTDANAALNCCDEAEFYVYDEQFDMLWLCPREIAVFDTHPCNDTYIFPASYDWLYTATHECASGVGPFFVRNTSRSQTGE
ncbi:protein of unknown function [Neorhodopirellula lusitana]|uniref:Uncharacterized protein n=1 Tax=Neorhodopirellula lusitana TaxID=445327 RepID=A0ABY1QNK0_9BACT|nr:DUF4275 family protein [Neorhodopirellula lusitana]SMP74413.1 protein of unknown function [Neorhodopirellula lusitana]